MDDRIEPRLIPVDAHAERGLQPTLERVWTEGNAALLVQHGLARKARQELLVRMGAGERITEGVALVIATSGVSGPPKGVELTHAALAASARAAMARLGAGSADRWLCCLPLHHVAGLQVLLRARLTGHPPVIHPRFSVAAVEAERDVTLVSLVPTMLHRLLEAKVDLRRFRAILLGGAPAPPQLLERAHDAGARVVVTYGMTESAGGCVYDGVPLDGVEVRTVGGVIELAGPVLMRGYRCDADATAEVLADGWFRTRDLGAIDDDGRLVVHGRADDVIVTGGEKVPAGRLAELLMAHPGIAEAAVRGIDDPEWGQRVVAYVVAAAGRTVPELPALRRFIAAAAPPSWAPREIVVVPHLPRTALGKLLPPLM